MGTAYTFEMFVCVDKATRFTARSTIIRCLKLLYLFLYRL